ncbi:MAG TPA: NAD(P)/FAD-dependent oxidoreductase [Oculatellaceae cyanobacterium]
MHKADVIVIGAGAAGLTAARALSNAQLHTVILEARDRIGGRIFSLERPDCPVPIELGAEFVHGSPPQLCAVIREAGVETIVVGANHISIDPQDSISNRGNLETIWETMHELDAPDTPDCSFTEFIARHEFDKRAAISATNFVEGFNAARAELISSKSVLLANQASAEIHGEEAQFRLKQPYSRIADALLNQCNNKHLDLHLNAPVKQVKWNDGEVICTTGEGITFAAKSAVITLPLSILQKKTVSFEPTLQEKEEALSLLEMGDVQRIFFQFRSQFWDHHTVNGRNLSKASFIHGGEAPFRTWWTLEPTKAPIMIAWNAGATYVEGVSEDSLVSLALQQLATMLQLSVEKLRAELVNHWFHDWHNDPYSVGAYSYCRVGGLYAPCTLAEPLKHTLFFAGEATDWHGHIGTVHAAIDSGERAAIECKAALANR